MLSSANITVLSRQWMRMMMMMKMKQWRSEGQQQESQPISSLLCHLFSLQVFSSQPRPLRDPLRLHPPPLHKQKPLPLHRPARPRPLSHSPPPVPPHRYDITGCIQVLLGNLCSVNFCQLKFNMKQRKKLRTKKNQNSALKALLGVYMYFKL